ncbi:MAG: translocation/assembly module TamB domain-containing protein [Nitrospirae bacterium]|nr:translocation/assembly module TamB domain-containing protein [Nitrospirota bacterium]
MNNDIVKLTDGRLLTDFSDGDFSGTVNTKTKIVNLSTIINTKDVQDITLPFRSDLKGGGTFNGTVVGISENPLISGKVSMHEGSFLDIKFSNMTSNISYNMDRFDLKNGIADVHKGKIDFQGGFDFIEPKHIFDFDKPMASYTAKIKGVSLDDITKTYTETNFMTGTIDSDMRVSGLAYDATVSGNMTIFDLKYNDKTFGQVTTDYSMRGKTLQLNNLIMRKDESYLIAKVDFNKKDEKVTWFDKKNVYYKIASKECSFNTANTQLSNFMGKTKILCDFNGSGILSDPGLNLHLNLSDKKINNILFGKGEINALIKDKKVKIDGKFSHDRSGKELIAISGNVYLNDQYTWALEVSLNPDRYDFLFPDIVKQRVEDFKISLNGLISLNGTINSVEGNIKIPNLSIHSLGEDITNPTPIIISIRNDNISINSLALHNGNNELKIGGSLVWNDNYNLFIRGSAYLKPFKILSENILLLDGRLEPDINIKGQWNSPNITGSVNIVDGTLGLKNFIYYLRSIKGKISINRNKFNIDNLNAKIGNGSVNMGGFMSINGKKIEEIYIESKLRNIPANLPVGLEMNLDADLNFKGDLNKNELSGNVIINKAKYTGKFNVQSKTNSPEKSDTNKGFFDNTQLNVNVNGDKNIIIKNELINTIATADLLIRGTMSTPNIFGKIVTNSGMVYFRNNRFDIKQANIQFDGQDDLNPYVETIATTSIRNYNIIMNLSGRAKQLNLTFSSNYELKEVEILSLLTIGDFSGDSKETTKIGASEASSFLSSELQGVFTDRFKDILGFDRLSVLPSLSDSLSSLNTQLSLSKWLIDQKLYVTASSTSNVLDNSIVRVEYILNKNLSLLGDSDKNGAIGADVKFKVEFK